MPIRTRGFRVKTGKGTSAYFNKQGQLTSTTVRSGRVTQTIKGGTMTTTVNLGRGVSHISTGDAPSLIAGLLGLLGAGVILLIVFFALR